MKLQIVRGIFTFVVIGTSLTAFAQRGENPGGNHASKTLSKVQPKLNVGVLNELSEVIKEVKLSPADDQESFDLSSAKDLGSFPHYHQILLGVIDQNRSLNDQAYVPQNSQFVESIVFVLSIKSENKNCYYVSEADPRAETADSYFFTAFLICEGMAEIKYWPSKKMDIKHLAKKFSDESARRSKPSNL